MDNQPAHTDQPDQPKPVDELLSVSDVARMYGVSDETVRLWIKGKKIDYVMVGPFRLKRIKKSEADKHYEEVKTQRKA